MPLWYQVEDGISRRALQSAGSEGRPMAGPVSVEDQTITFVTPKGQILVPPTLFLIYTVSLCILMIYCFVCCRLTRLMSSMHGSTQP